MRVVNHSSSSILQRFVKKMWIIEDNPDLSVHVKSFPVGYSFLNIINGHPFNIKHKKEDITTKSYLTGIQTGYFDLNMRKIKRALMIQLQPFAIPYLFNIPASVFINKIMPLEEINKNLANILEDLVEGNFSSEKVLELAEFHLIKGLKDATVEGRVLRSLEIILNYGGDLKIDYISNKINLSQRRLQQLFKSNFGISAKSYSRIVKMQYHTFQLLTGKDLDMIIPDGYYDQSHFIHEIKRQTGFLPSAFSNYINKESHKAAYLTSNLYY